MVVAAVAWLCLGVGAATMVLIALLPSLSLFYFVVMFSFVVVGIYLHSVAWVLYFCSK